MQIKAEQTDNDLYIADKQLLAAINTALFLRRPLLLSGDPGTGKTECANFVARKLHQQHGDLFLRERALRFDTKSISQSTDLFYSYDAVAHFGDRGNSPKAKFISFNTLGLAILNTRGKEKHLDSFRNYQAIDEKPTGSVVLIDEIDKAPRDFPNDLLSELEKPPFKFRIREMDDMEVSQDQSKPVVIIITSNNEKGLPDAFLRRCVFHHINFPEKKDLLRIIKTKLERDDIKYEYAIDTFLQLRKKGNMAKLPATSELIDWISCLERHELLSDRLVDSRNADEEYRKKVVDTLGIIAKCKPDYETLKKEFAGQ